MTTKYVDYINGQDGTGGHNGSSPSLAYQAINYARGQTNARFHGLVEINSANRN